MKNMKKVMAIGAFVAVSSMAFSVFAAQGTTIGAVKAKEKALAHAGLKASDVIFTEAKLDIDDGVKHYDVDFYANGVEYDYEIHATNGSIISVDREVKNGAAIKPSTPTTTNTQTIGAVKAKEKALAHAGDRKSVV